MPLEIIRNDITKVRADVIVNAANPTLLGGGGVDGAIHRAAGPELLAECKTLGRCETGQAKITKGYRLPAKYIIHTVGPIWHGGNHQEEKLLRSCYKNSLALAKEYQVESIAFPLISSGSYGYPMEQAIQVAISEISSFLLQNDMLIYLVVYDKTSFVCNERLLSAIQQYIDDKYIEETIDLMESSGPIVCLRDTMEELPEHFFAEEAPRVTGRKRSLDEVVNHMDETFSQMLLRLIKEKGMTEAETYKKANIDRKLFSKIRNDIHYQPSKPTAIAFAIALQLNLDETRDLLRRAGYALSHSCKFDLIIEYFIEEGNYNIFEINEALFTFNETLLGIR